MTSMEGLISAKKKKKKNITENILQIIITLFVFFPSQISFGRQRGEFYS